MITCLIARPVMCPVAGMLTWVTLPAISVGGPHRTLHACLQVWAERPLTAELLNYAASDVRYLHQLADSLNMKLPSIIVDKVSNNLGHCCVDWSRMGGGGVVLLSITGSRIELDDLWQYVVLPRHRLCSGD